QMKDPDVTDHRVLALFGETHHDPRAIVGQLHRGEGAVGQVGPESNVGRVREVRVQVRTAGERREPNEQAGRQGDHGGRVPRVPRVPGAVRADLDHTGDAVVRRSSSWATVV